MLYLHLLDNDLSDEPDDYLGEGRLSLAALVAGAARAAPDGAGGGEEQTVQLTACTHALKLAEWAASGRTPENLDVRGRRSSGHTHRCGRERHLHGGTAMT